MKDTRRKPQLRVTYLLEDAHASKTLYAKLGASGQTIIEEMDKAVDSAFGDEPYLLAKNKGRKSRLDSRSNVTPLPHVPNGLNEYRHFTKIAVTSATNRTPFHCKLLSAIGVPDEVIRNAAHERVLQAITRTAIRDRHSTAMVDAIVPDRWAAEYVAGKLGCEKIERIGNIKTPEKPPFTGQQIKQRKKAKAVRREFFTPETQS